MFIDRNVVDVSGGEWLKLWIGGDNSFDCLDEWRIEIPVRWIVYFLRPKTCRCREMREHTREVGAIYQRISNLFILLMAKLLLAPKLENEMLKLIVNNSGKKKIVAGQRQSATIDSEFNEKNPNCRAMMLVFDAENSKADSNIRSNPFPHSFV